MKKEQRFRFVEGMMRRRIKYVGERPAQKHTTPSPSFVMHKITILFRPRDITAAKLWLRGVMTRSLSDFGQVKSSELSRAKAMPAPNFKGKEGERHRRSELRIWLFRSGSDRAVLCRDLYCDDAGRVVVFRKQEVDGRGRTTWDL